MRVDEQGRPTTPAHEAARAVAREREAGRLKRPRDDGLNHAYRPPPREQPGTQHPTRHEHRDAHSGAYVAPPHGVSMPSLTGSPAVSHMDTGNGERMRSALQRARLEAGQQRRSPGHRPPGR